MLENDEDEKKKAGSDDRTHTWPPETVRIWYGAFRAGGGDWGVRRGGTRLQADRRSGRLGCRVLGINILNKVWTEIIYDTVVVGAGGICSVGSGGELEGLQACVEEGGVLAGVEDVAGHGGGHQAAVEVLNARPGLER